MRTSKDPKPPRGLAEFVASANRAASTGPETIYEELKAQWRAACEGDDVKSSPTTTSVGRALGISHSTAHRHVCVLLDQGRLVRIGRGSHARYVPNEDEFTAGLPKEKDG